MKKYILIVVIFLTGLTTQAQKFDKDLLYGKWVWVGLRSGVILMHQDSLQASIASLLKLSCTDRVGYTCTADDTAGIVIRISKMAEEYKTNFMVFTGSNDTGFINLIDKNTDVPAAAFKWVSDTELKVTGLGSKYTVIRLTKKELVLIMDVSESETTVLYMRRKGRS